MHLLVGEKRKVTSNKMDEIEKKVKQWKGGWKVTEKVIKGQKCIVSIFLRDNTLQKINETCSKSEITVWSTSAHLNVKRT